MPTASIEVNAVAGSDDDVPINTLVQLSNGDTGGEVTYLWEILDQPDGAADALSSSAIENPTFTPRKEGSYLIRLTVNDGLANEVSDTAVVAVRQLKTNERVPAALETIEVDSTKGWKPAVNRLLQMVDDVTRDANVIVAVNPGASFPTTGDIVRLTQTALIKTGLPGEERLVLVETALATLANNVRGELGVVIGTPTGAAPAANGLVLVRVLGLVEVAEAGAPAIGDLVYVNDTAQPSLTPGTVSRVIGRVVFSTAGVWRWVIDTSTEYLTRLIALESGAASGFKLLGRQIFTANGTYTPTAGTRAVRMRECAGGGAGGSCDGGAQASVAGGGGAGGYCETFINPGALITGGAVTVGAAGAAAAAGNNPGGNGGNTSIVIQGVTYTVGGGTGGSGGGPAAAGLTVNGGSGGTAAASGDITFAGQPGSPGIRIDTTNGVAGSGAPSPFGGGGKGFTASLPGAGSGFGAGGGGAIAGATTVAGAAGVQGVVIVEEYI